MKTRKSLPLGLILLLCICLLPISASSAQTITPPDTKIPNFECYRDAASIISKMQHLTDNYPSLTYFSEIGKSVEERSIYAFEIGNETNENKPHFVLLTGLHGNDFSQPEVALQFAEKLLEGYNNDADMKWIVDNIEIDLILLANPDGRLEAEGQAMNTFDSNDVTFITNKKLPNNIDLEENFCFSIPESSEGCSTYTFEPETQAIINYLTLKLGEPITNQPPQYDSQNFFIYFSSHNKEKLPSDTYSNYKGRLRISNFFPPYSTELSDPTLLRTQELTEMLRVFGSSPIYNIETFMTEGKSLEKYPVDFAYLTHGIASVELSAPPTYDSRPMECYMFTSEHVKNYTKLLENAAKSATQPYQIGFGPIVKDLKKTDGSETEFQYQAVIWEKNQAEGQYEPNSITSIQYFIDQSNGTVSKNLDEWNIIERTDNVWKIEFGIDGSALELDKHILTLQACSEDEFDNTKEVCGLPLSAYLDISDPSDTDPPDPPDDPYPPGTGSKLYLPLIGR